MVVNTNKKTASVIMLCLTNSLNSIHFGMNAIVGGIPAKIRINKYLFVRLPSSFIENILAREVLCERTLFNKITLKKYTELKSNSSKIFIEIITKIQQLFEIPE